MRIARWLLGREVEHTGLILGNDASGKTTMLYQLKLGEEITAIPTIGFNVETVEYPRGRKATLWDVGGCDQIRPLIRHYMSANNFLIFVHDCTEYAERVEDSIIYLKQVLNWMTDLDCKYMWIIFNKQDALAPAESESIVSNLRQRFESEVAQYRDKITINVMDTPGLSGRTGEQLDTVMTDIISTLQNEKKKTTATTTASTTMPKNPELQGPSEKELMGRIRQANQVSDSPDAFWTAFLAGDLHAWDHYSHLRAGFFVMYDCFARGFDVFDTADEFLSHLKRLREQQPERFRNTAHKTMTIFWLVQIQIAATAYQTERKLEGFPTLDAYADVLELTPQLMNSGLWRAYYSKDLMFSPEAMKDWHLPDLKPLPTTTQQPSKPRGLTRSPSQGDADRLLRFAFTVIQTTLTSKVRRGGIVKQALETLQSSTIRLRATDPSVPPYSETQAYFWIQFTHAALRSLELDPASQAGEKPKFKGLITALEFTAFKALFGLEGHEWREYYTPSIWDAVSSRMTFANPDKKPLPNVIAIASQANVALARTRMVDTVNYRLTALVELPPREELAFIAAVLIDEAKLMSQAHPNVASRAGLLLFIHRRIFVPLETLYEKSKSLANVAAETALQLSPSLGCTQAMFWVQQVLIAKADMTDVVPFESFVKQHVNLAYENLPFMYYSPGLWFSGEAREVYMPPDRNSSPSFVARKSK